MKELCFSGIQPTNNVHIGNYIGAIKQWAEIQHRYPCFFCIVDLHAITVAQDPKALRDNNMRAAATYLACGIDPKRSRLFIQSEIPEHSELAWVLSTVTKMVELERMTQFKDKAKKFSSDVEKREIIKKILLDMTRDSKLKEYNNIQNILENQNTNNSQGVDLNANKILKFLEHLESERKLLAKSPGVGLFTYPALMAADILLYDTTDVPVGEDQLQHVELTRTIARRFNAQFGDTFVVPKSLVQEFGARIMGLDDPKMKMSKSAKSSLNYLALTDTDDEIAKKIKKAVTDSDGDISYDTEKRPAVSNLMTIYHHATGITMKELQAKYAGKGYGEFKNDLTEAVVAMISPIRGRIANYMNDRSQLDKILDVGRDAAKAIAEPKMKVVRERVGLGR
jgi:tryptophanyl-tRNA synthetase